MKIKVVLASIAVVAIAVVAFAFTTNSKKTIQTVYFAAGTCKQKISVASGQPDCRDNSIGTGNLFKDASNWSTTSNGTTFASSTDYIAALDFDNSQLTLQQALDGVYNYYSSNSNSLPDNNGTVMVGSSSVTIHRTLSHY
jgi:hypothetical protein